MSFDHHHYVPCLRWKQGEYQAILNLSNAAKDSITPLIEVPEIGFDFETQIQKKSVDDHLALFVKRVKPKWGGRLCQVDLRLITPAERMADNRHPVEYVLDELRSQGCKVTPVVGLGRDQEYQRAVRQAVLKDRCGSCLRISLEEAAKPSIKESVDALLKNIHLKASECNLVLDLGAPNFEPIDGFAKLIEAITQRLPSLRQWRTFTLLGTSFPSSMGGIEQGSATILRREWLLYKKLARSLADGGSRVPAFGDYAISHPDVPLLDMRLVKPSATIRYATDDAWLIVKGPNVRDHRFEQYRRHCQDLIASSHYMGAEFSWGDRYIADCATGKVSTGNLTTWRKVGTNRHLEKVVSDIANLFDSSGTP